MQGHLFAWLLAPFHRVLFRNYLININVYFLFIVIIIYLLFLI